MPGAPRELAKNTIDVNKGSKPIKQRLHLIVLNDIMKDRVLSYPRQWHQKWSLVFVSVT
jgi:hypothetical protein